MLDRTEDDVPLASEQPLEDGADDGLAEHLPENGSLERVIAGFAAAAGEDNFVGPGAEEVGDLLPRELHGVVSGLTQAMRAGRVAVVVAQVGQHGIEHGRIDGRGSVVVEVDRLHNRHVPKNMGNGGVVER